MAVMFAMIRLELARAFRDRFVWLALAAQVVMAFVARQGALSLAGSRGIDGPAYTVFSMNLAGTLSTPLLSAIFAAGVLAGDSSRGTIRVILAWPQSRIQVLLAKASVACVVAMTLAVIHLVVTILIALPMQLEAGADPEFPLRTVGMVWAELGLAAGLGLVPLLATVAMAMAISATCQQAPTAIGVTVGVLLLMEPVKLLLPSDCHGFLFPSHYDTATAIAFSRVDQIAADWWGRDIAMLWISSLLAWLGGGFIAYLVFSRRSVTP